MFGLKELRSRVTGVKQVLVILISLRTLWSLTIYGVNERWNKVSFWVYLRLGDTRVSTCPLCLLVNTLINGRDIRLFIILRAMIGFKFFKSHFLVTDHGVCVGSCITVALLKTLTINSKFKEIQSL